MKDLTRGSISRHIAFMAAPIAVSMIFQTVYYLVDLFFVAKLGNAAIAGVSAAGNVTFLVFSLTQMLGVGTVALISHAAGRKDRPEANLLFNQSLLLAGICGILTFVAGYALGGFYISVVAADEATRIAGVDYLYWYIPGLSLQFAMIAMGSALRGTGITKPMMIIQMCTIVINVALAPMLIAGWGTGHPMGVAGAGLATSIAIACGVVLLLFYFVQQERYVAFHPRLWQPRIEYWKKILNIGLPAGGEFALLFVFSAVSYWAIGTIGPTAQAGFGVGSRVIQAIFLPAMAIAFATAPIAGQNFAAGQFDRVREVFRGSASVGALIMGTLTLFCQLRPEMLVGMFATEPRVIAIGATFLQVLSWSFIPQGLIFTCSSLFQGLGNTWPSLVSSGSRIVTYTIPTILLASWSGFELMHLWVLSLTTLALQAITSLLLLRTQFIQRLPNSPS